MDSFLGFRSLTNSTFLGGHASSARATPRGYVPVTRDGAPGTDDNGTSHSTTSSRKSGAGSSSSTLAKMDRLLEPGKSDGGAGQEEPDADDSEEGEAQAQAPARGVGDEEAAAAADAGADATEERISRRPCKAKRDRYKSLVDRHMEIIRADPHGFSMDRVIIPQFVAMDTRLSAKFRARLENFAREVLEGGGDAAQVPVGFTPHRAGAQASAGTGAVVTPGAASTQAWAPPNHAGHDGPASRAGGGRGSAARGGRGRARGSITLSL